MSICVGVANKARRVTQMYVGVDGKARHIKKIYIGVNNKASLVYSSLSQIIKDIPTTPGQVCNWSGYNWTVVHVTTDLIYMILTNIYSMTTFGSNTSYSQSNLVNLCNQFLNSIDASYRNALADVTVNGVTQKVFVPAHGMVCNNSPTDGTTKYPVFSWFNSAYGTSYANRVATYNGSARHWWTSTAYTSSLVWLVPANDNAASYVYSPSYSYGFRPCIAVRRK